MGATTGRTVSAGIVQRLREALTQGEPRSYQQLADHAQCTVRSVRNYLARSSEIFGFDIEATRNAKHQVLVRALTPTPQPETTSSTTNDPFSSAFLDALFPATRTTPSRCVVIALPNMPRYGLHQERIARTWAACSRSREQAVRLRIPTLCHSNTVWSKGVVVHHDAGVVLVGIPCDATSWSQIMSIGLHSVPDEAGLLEEVPKQRPAWIDDVSLRDLIDIPFCGAPISDEPMVDVHVRFDAKLTEQLRSCVWHRSQQVVLRTDGRLDVRFGPVPLARAASWAASFGSGATIIGTKALRKAVKKRSFSP